MHNYVFVCLCLCVCVGVCVCMCIMYIYIYIMYSSISFANSPYKILFSSYDFILAGYLSVLAVPAFFQPRISTHASAVTIIYMCMLYKVR